MKKYIKKVIANISGKKLFQPFFETLYKVALKGMNVGGGNSISCSGERYIIQEIKQRLINVNNLILFDVGAHHGQYSILLNDTFGRNAQIFSFEPSQNTFNTLVTNTCNRSKISPYKIGLGAENQRTTLFSNADGSELASLYKRRLDHFDIQLNQIEEIEIKSIDEFCKEHQINHIHLLKLDVEGHELSVLKGARNIIASQAVDYIQFEFGGCNIDSRTYFQDFFYLLNDDYHIYRILKNGLCKIDRYSEVYEAFKTTNYLAERIGRDDYLQ